MDKAPPLVRGRKIAILVADGIDSAIVKTIVGELTKAGQVPELIGPTAGAAVDTATKPLPVNRAAPNAPSVIYDAVLISPGVAEGLAALLLHSLVQHRFPRRVSNLAPD